MNLQFFSVVQSSLEKSQSVIVETLANRDNTRTKETELQQQLAIVSDEKADEKVCFNDML